MIIHCLSIKVAPRDHNSAVRTIKSMIGTTRVKSGCLMCSLYTQIDNDDELLLVDKWDSQETFEDHLRSRQYGLLLEVMELAVETPFVEIHSSSGTRDFEYIKALRAKRSACGRIRQVARNH